MPGANLREKNWQHDVKNIQLHEKKTPQIYEKKAEIYPPDVIWYLRRRTSVSSVWTAKTTETGPFVINNFNFYFLSSQFFSLSL